MMTIEVDQSNKIKRTERDTVLAFSSDQLFSIVLPAAVKREALDRLIPQGKSCKTGELHLFAAGLFLLLKVWLGDTNTREERVLVDAEYTGHEGTTKGMLLRHASMAELRLASSSIVFGRVGKRSRAYHIAWAVQRGKREPDRRIALQELLELLK